MTHCVSAQGAGPMKNVCQDPKVVKTPGWVRKVGVYHELFCVGILEVFHGGDIGLYDNYIMVVAQWRIDL